MQTRTVTFFVTVSTKFLGYTYSTQHTFTFLSRNEPHTQDFI